MAAGPRRITVARIGAAHGVAGWLRLKPFTGEPGAIARYGPLETADGRGFEIVGLKEAKGGLLVRFKGVDDRTAAEALTGLELSVPRARLPGLADEDEFYQADLVGLAAETADGAPLGRVTAVLNYGAGDILEIRPEQGASILVPFTRAAVPEIDMERGRLVVEPPVMTGDPPGSGEDGA